MGLEYPENCSSWFLQRQLDTAKKENERLTSLLIQALSFIERTDIGEVARYLGLYTSHELAQWWEDHRHLKKPVINKKRYQRNKLTNRGINGNR